jgi:hypothetical protein
VFYELCESTKRLTRRKWKFYTQEEEKNAQPGQRAEEDPNNFLRSRWAQMGPKGPGVMAPPQELGNKSDTNLPIVKRRATTVPFPGKHWKEIIDHDGPLVRKIAEIRQAREYFLHQRNETRFENRYRYLGCTMTRNEPRLREWILRNFIAGMEHIIIYDNNRVEQHADHNITEVLAPFVEAGIVTHERWPRKNADLSKMVNSVKFEMWEDCVQNYGAWTDWFIPLDTDEHMVYWTAGEHPLKPETAERNPGPGSDLVEGYNYNIFPIHEVMNGIESNVGAFSFRWLVPYNEHMVLQSPKPLLTAFPRNCVVDHSLNKVIFRPTLTNKLENHSVRTLGLQLRTKVTDNKKPPTPGSGAAWLHYYGKSVEEWIWKKEQSFKEWHRYMATIYDSSGYDRTCGKETLIYPTGYINATLYMLDLARSVPEAGTLLRKNLYPRTDDLENSLYLFCKWIVEAGYEWDEESYLSMYPEVQVNITTPSRKKPLIDGLHHFLRDGYRERKTSCWFDTNLPNGSPPACF